MAKKSTTKKSSAKKTSTKSRKPATASKKRTSKKVAAKKVAAKKAPTKKAKSAVAEEEVTIDRRRDERREETAEAAVNESKPSERRDKVQRRRQIDPTTCERDYSDSEVEFMNAMDEYKRTSGRMFPTCSEVLEVLRNLGYEQLNAAELEMLGRTSSEDELTEATESDESSDIDFDAEDSFAESELVG